MVTAGKAEYTLLDGDPMPLTHHGEEFTLAAKPVVRKIPPITPGPRPAQPPGRDPYKRS
jgi:alpha,alpha-trehalose phosphorylase